MKLLNALLLSLVSFPVMAATDTTTPAPTPAAPAKPTTAQSSNPTAPSPTPVPSQTSPSSAMPNDLQNLSNMSIADLANVSVTSAGDKKQKLSDVSAALSVISADDIERSGATNIPDLLRYTPGVQVSTVNNGEQSVGIRGFGGQYSGELLVLVDGLSIYTPVFGGVEWQNQAMLMDNIDRVEVIRGPGAAIWGANAVNGVINIITKDAADTQGGYASTIYGTKETGTGEFRYGFHPLDGLDVRMYGMYQQQDPTMPEIGTQRFDTYSTATGGFRADYRPTTDDHFRLSTDVSNTNSGAVVNSLLPNPTYTAYTSTYVPVAPVYINENTDEKVNFVYEHNVDPDNIITTQAYYWRTATSSSPTGENYTAITQTADFQIRHSLPINILPIKQELVYGAEYRLNTFETGPGLFYFQRNTSVQTVSAFAQTDLHLIDDVLTLTGGVRYDHNDYTGNEVQPSVRLLGKINPTNSVWVAASRAVSEPNLVSREGAGAIVIPPDIQSEVLRETEIGYRTQVTKDLSFDVTGYYNDYSDIVAVYQSPYPYLYKTQLRQVDKVDLFGVEPSFQAQLQPWWHLNGSYSFNQFNYHPGPTLPGYTERGVTVDQENIHNQSSIHSAFDLPQNVTIDVGGRYVEETPFGGGYTCMDIRVGWKPTANWALSVDARNLFMANHIENTGNVANAAYVGPEVYGKVVFKF